MKSIAAPIATAIAELIKLIKMQLETKDVRDMKKAIRAAEGYIRVNEGDGRYAKLSDEKKKKYLVKFNERFFKYNN